MFKLKRNTLLPQKMGTQSSKISFIEWC